MSYYPGTDKIIPMDDPEELLDVVDSTDQLIGILPRKHIHKLKLGQYFRAIGCFVVNSRGQLCVPKRQSNKKIAPKGLDFTVGEHVGSEETYDQAVVRGLAEEAKIIAIPSKLVFIGIIPPFDGLPYFHHVFTYHSDETPHLNGNDYSGYEWLAPALLLQKLRTGTPAKEILLPSIELLMSKLNVKEAENA